MLSGHAFLICDILRSAFLDERVVKIYDPNIGSDIVALVPVDHCFTFNKENLNSSTPLEGEAIAGLLKVQLFIKNANEVIIDLPSQETVCLVVLKSQLRFDEEDVFFLAID